jgi:nicotinate-nucleotide adenylyltransferase
VRIGIFGGTFNPVHSGHLVNAQHVAGEFHLDRIVFVPAREPVHKPLEGGAGAEDRLIMLELAVRGNDVFEVSRIELDREEPSYTIITLDDMGKLYPGAELFLVIGADSYNQLGTWMDYRRILAGAGIIVMRRPGDDVDRGLYSREGGNVLFAGNPLIEISSKRLRSMIKSGESVRYLVPDDVREYIKDRKLYWN